MPSFWEHCISEEGLNRGKYLIVKNEPRPLYTWFLVASNHSQIKVYLFPKRQILDASKLKESADDNFKFYENGKQLSKWVENTVGKGEIARYEQFLLFPQCFQKTLTVDT